MKVADAIEAIVTSYGDIELIARGLSVDAAELAKVKADPDTAEAIAVALLKKYNKVVIQQEVVQETAE